MLFSWIYLASNVGWSRAFSGEVYGHSSMRSLQAWHGKKSLNDDRAEGMVVVVMIVMMMTMMMTMMGDDDG